MATGLILAGVSPVIMGKIRCLPVILLLGAVGCGSETALNVNSVGSSSSTSSSNTGNGNEPITPGTLNRLDPYIAAISTTSGGVMTLVSSSSSSSVSLSQTASSSSTAFTTASSSSSSTSTTSTISVNGLSIVSVIIPRQVVTVTDPESESFVLAEPTGISLSFNETQARLDGLSEEEIAEGKEHIVSLASLVSTNSVLPKEEDVRPLTLRDVTGYNKFINGSGVRDFFRYIADHQDNPKHIPGEESFATKLLAQRAIVNRGFHLVQAYASGGGNRNLTNFQAYASSNNDRGRPQELYSRGSYIIPRRFGCYRDEVNLVPISNRWRYWLQNHEPNPELHAYTWPIWWWGYYAYWYHQDGGDTIR